MSCKFLNLCVMILGTSISCKPLLMLKLVKNLLILHQTLIPVKMHRPKERICVVVNLIKQHIYFYYWSDWKTLQHLHIALMIKYFGQKLLRQRYPTNLYLSYIEIGRSKSCIFRDKGLDGLSIYFSIVNSRIASRFGQINQSISRLFSN